MTFTKAVIRQVGRDLGKVISNSVFKDRHSTPYRRVGSKQYSANQSKSQKVEVVQQQSISSSDFDQAIGFSTTFTPPTMVRKLAGVYEVIKSELRKATDDGYLDADEAKLILQMESDFQHKSEVIADLLQLDEAANEKALDELDKLVHLTNQLFIETLQLAIEGTKVQEKYYLDLVQQVKNLSFLNCVGLHAVWMGKFAKTGKHNWLATVVGNFISLILLLVFWIPVGHIFGAFIGMVVYFQEVKRRNQLRLHYKKEADLERKRRELFLSVIQPEEH
ncbi:MAG: hypothetical protein ACQESK_01680 [Bacteroidota bacterium]